MKQNAFLTSLEQPTIGRHVYIPDRFKQPPDVILYGDEVYILDTLQNVLGTDRLRYFLATALVA